MVKVIGVELSKIFKLVMKIVFDLSDVVKYAIGNSSVSGIQRVQLKIVAEFAQTKRSGDDVWVSYFDEDAREFFYVRPDELLQGEGFDSELMLGRLGKVKKRFFPEKFRIKRYLKKFESNKIRRGLEKIFVYAMTIFSRRWLRKVGVLPGKNSEQVREITRESAGQMCENDVFVLLGSFWDYDQVMLRAEAHNTTGGRVFALVHDLIPILAPNFSTVGLNKIFEEFVPRLKSVATHLMAVSRHTASDLAGVLGVPVSSVKLLPLAHEFSGYDRNSICKINLPPDLRNIKYALCVGTIEVRKNGLLLLKLWKRMLDQGMDNIPHLVFAGKYGWRVSEFKEFLTRHCELKAIVHLVNGPGDDGLASLYANAEFCVFPSHYEGWGLPVGEAAWFGNYVIASSVSSVPEVCGRNVMDYVSPVDPDAWFDILCKVINEPTYLNMKKEQVKLMHCRRWQDVAEDLRIILKSE
jgi:glycosyltransferase involved in cell wall biosynthesis